MRCEDLRERLDELWAGEAPAEVREHLAGCAACAGYVLELRLVRAGFHALAAERAPEPSLGFAARLGRRLGEAAQQGRAAEEFFERVGRRFVYATLAVTLGLLLALVLPSSGPVRGLAADDLLAAQAETATLQSDSLLGADWQESPEAVPVEPAQSGQKGQK